MMSRPADGATAKASQPVVSALDESDPLTVRPELQERGIARALLARTMEQFDSWGTRHVGLFTFAQSAKHIALYQKYGFSARFLTAIMSAPVSARRGAAGWSRFSQLSEARQNEALRSCRDVAATLYPGLDLTEEIDFLMAINSAE